MIIKNEQQLAGMRAAGKILARVLLELEERAKPGVATAELDAYAQQKIKEEGAIASFLNYQPEWADSPYPAALCVSINDEIVHGIPGGRVIEEGDIVSLDLGLHKDGYFVDAARTVVAGQGDERAHKLVDATREAFDEALKAVHVGGRVGDIGAAVVRTAKQYGFAPAKDLGGHAVGGAVHEPPYIANDAKAGTGDTIADGLVLAIEPMLCEGKGGITFDEDGWTCRTRDGKRAAHYENTVLISKEGAEVLTQS